MKINLKKLTLRFRRSTEVLEFPHLSYFYGPIGSGKSSIARLIDYCLGANVAWTWALQQEFVSATLDLDVNGTSLTLERARDSMMLVACWEEKGEHLQLTVPSRKAAGELMHGTGVEVLSDLIFFLAKIDPPKVRRQKDSSKEHLERLSFRELFRFCYLDQDGMDNIFFKLDSENYAVQRKSVDALRYLLGYHQEKLAQLEAELQNIRDKRFASQAGADALEKALLAAGFDDAQAIEAKIEETKAAIELARRQAVNAREGRGELPHAVDALRSAARSLTTELFANEQAMSDLEARINDLVRHDNELRMLSMRFQRTATARSIVGGVDFKDCPRCTQSLPERTAHQCQVCGQTEHINNAENALSEEVVKQDLRARQAELKETIAKMKAEQRRLGFRKDEIITEKSQIERAFNAQMRDYDSAFVSQALEHERIVVTQEQKLSALLHNSKLPEILNDQRASAEVLIGEEAEARARLEAVRKTVFRDRKNIEKLGELFLDCLLRVKFPDVKASFHVEIDPSTFLPKITFGAEDGFVALSFANAGSGGMKSLFKTCYALAIHRLCATLKSELPNLLIIDTATKNVSSLENPEVVKAFYKLVYELTATELKNTQFVILDNEYTEPPLALELEIKIRHMINGSQEYPPLIPYLVSAQGGDVGSLGDGR